jgi:starvation-inducible outer membrane lipoprotein
MNWRIRVGLSLWLLTLAVLVATCMAVPQAQAQNAGRKPSVPICRMVHGHRVCLLVHGGSGITPPIFMPKRNR